MSLTPRLRTSVPVLAALVLVVACGQPDPADPAAPGPTSRPASADPTADPAAIPPHVDAERLVARYGCTACHAPPADAVARLAPVPAPDLTDVGVRMTLPGLASWAVAPRPGADGAHGCGASVPAEDALDLAAWLASADSTTSTAPVEVLPVELEAGRLLFDSLGCRACHDGDGAKGGLDVDGLAAERTIANLATMLAEPHLSWPAGGHPDLDLDDLRATRLATWILAGDRAPLTRTPGLRFEYYEAEDFPGPEPDWDAMTPVAVGTADVIGIDERRRDDQFGLRFTGGVDLPATGTYTFFLGSDDGSYLDLGGERVLDHGGLHGPWVNEVELDLEAGPTPLRVSMFERTGGEELMLEFQVVSDDGEVLVERRPFAPDELYFESGTYEPPAVFPAPRLGLGGMDPADLMSLGDGGRAVFDRHGCAGCHASSAGPATPVASAPDLARLAPGAGCLDPGRVGGGATPVGERSSQAIPRLAVLADTPEATAERLALDLYLADPAKPTGPLAPAELLARELPRLGCLACHVRDGVGGPSDAARPWFRQDYDADDLGDEGRVPPSLTGVGAKLQRDWLADVVTHGTAGGMGVRPYMATPMPAFGEDVAARLADAFEAVDAADLVDLAPAWSEPVMEVGRQLVGISGLACITCHDVAGKPGLGIPMIDLANTPDRLRHDWFRRWLLDPVGMRPGTRMSAFYPDGKGLRTDILDGDADAQIDAMWTYLSLGDALPLPEGLVLDPAAYDLEPSDGVIHHACFWEGGSARGIAVGFPERKHYAFDQEHLRVDALWTGAFVNGSHTWDGRAGGLAVPEGEHVLELPDGMAVARLAGPDAAWPTEHRRELGWRYLGQRRDADDVPTWRYELSGAIVEETLRPIFGPGGHFLRSFRFSGMPELSAGGGGFCLALATGEATATADGVWSVTLPGDDEPDLELRVTGAELVTTATGRVTLWLDPDPDGTLDVEVEYRW